MKSHTFFILLATCFMSIIGVSSSFAIDSTESGDDSTMLLAQIDPPPTLPPVCACSYPPLPADHSAVITNNLCNGQPYPACMLDSCTVYVYDGNDEFVSRTVHRCIGFGGTA
jgi:hypothetical protein